MRINRKGAIILLIASLFVAFIAEGFAFADVKLPEVLDVQQNPLDQADISVTLIANIEGLAKIRIITPLPIISLKDHRNKPLKFKTNPQKNEIYLTEGIPLKRQEEKRTFKLKVDSRKLSEIKSVEIILTIEETPGVPTICVAKEIEIKPKGIIKEAPLEAASEQFVVKDKRGRNLSVSVPRNAPTPKLSEPKEKK